MKYKLDNNWFLSEPWQYNPHWDNPTDSYEPIQEGTLILSEVRQDSDRLKHDGDMPWTVCTERDCSIHYTQKEEYK